MRSTSTTAFGGDIGEDMSMKLWHPVTTTLRCSNNIQRRRLIRRLSAVKLLAISIALLFSHG
jgi:hypothetical protein